MVHARKFCRQTQRNFKIDDKSRESDVARILIRFSYYHRLKLVPSSRKDRCRSCRRRSTGSKVRIHQAFIFSFRVIIVNFSFSRLLLSRTAHYILSSLQIAYGELFYFPDTLVILLSSVRDYVLCQNKKERENYKSDTLIIEGSRVRQYKLYLNYTRNNLLGIY